MRMEMEGLLGQETGVKLHEFTVQHILGAAVRPRCRSPRQPTTSLQATNQLSITTRGDYPDGQILHYMMVLVLWTSGFDVCRPGANAKGE
jgi:hypothetical protein